jgi:hypothetical protein
MQLPVIAYIDPEAIVCSDYNPAKQCRVFFAFACQEVDELILASTGTFWYIFQLKAEYKDQYEGCYP